MQLTGYHFQDLTLLVFGEEEVPQQLILHREGKILDCSETQLRMLFGLVRHAPEAVPVEKLHPTADVDSTLSKLATRIEMKRPLPWRSTGHEFSLLTEVRRVQIVPPVGPAVRHLLSVASTPNFRPSALRPAIFEPVVHTLSLAHVPGRREWFEMKSAESRDGKEHRINCLTGCFETKAVQLLQAVAHTSAGQIIVLPVAAAADFEKPQLLEYRLQQHAMVWIGSPFNENHGLRALLKQKDLWRRVPECSWTFEETGEYRVKWPGNEDVVHKWQSGDDWQEQQTEYVLVASLTPKPDPNLVANGKSLHRLVVCGGTDTISTFTAAQLTFSEDSKFLSWLEQEEQQVNGSTEALFRITVENGARLGPPEPVWPDRLVKWQMEEQKAHAKAAAK